MKLPKSMTDFRILVARSKWDLLKAEESEGFFLPLLTWFLLGGLGFAMMIWMKAELL